MPRVKVQLADNIKRVVVVDTDATRGAKLGRDLFMPNGQVGTPAAVRDWLGLGSGGGADIRNGYGIAISGTSPKTVSVNRAANFDWQGQHNWEKPLWAPAGTAAAPAYTFSAQQDLGAYRAGADNYGIATAGVLRWDVDTARTYQTVPLIVRTGDGEIAAFQNVADPDGAGISVTTTYDALGSDTYFDFKETSVRYFRLGNRGNPPADAFFELSRFGSSAAVDGTIFSVARETAGIDFLEQLRVSDGSQSAPSFAFTSEPTKGIFSLGANTIGMEVGAGARDMLSYLSGDTEGSGYFLAFGVNNRRATGGASAFRLNNSGTLKADFVYFNTGYSGSYAGNSAALRTMSGVDLAFSIGGATASSISWTMRAADGAFRALDSNELQLGTGGDLRLFHNGTNSTIRNDTGNLSVLSGSTEVLRFIQGASSRVHALNGTAARPTFGWFGDPDNGLYYITTNSFGIATAGALRYQYGAAGQLGIGGANYGTADTQAIVSGGASAAPSWQTVLVDGQAQTLGGNKTWTGTHTFSTAPVLPAASIADAALSSNVALKNASNVFTQMQRIAYTGAQEQLRLNHDHALLTFFNAANSARSGYLWFRAANTSQIWIEANQGLDIGTNNTARMRLAAAGNVSIFVPSSGPTLSVSGLAGTPGLNYQAGAVTVALGYESNSAAYIGPTSAHSLGILAGNITRMFFASTGGAIMGSPTGGNMGNNTLNTAGNIYVNGVLVGFRDVLRRTSGLARGECLSTSSGITLNTSDMAAGYTFSIFNNSGSAITITQGSGVTLYGPAGATGNRTLAARGIATIWCDSGTAAKISGDVT